MGTGGALSLLPENVEHTIVVLNGDLVTEVHFGHLLDHHESGGSDTHLLSQGMRPHNPPQWQAQQVAFQTLQLKSDMP